MNESKTAAIVFDDLENLIPKADDPDGIGQEWEDKRTILGQKEALEANGYRVRLVTFDKQLIGRLEKERPSLVFNISEGHRGKDRESIVPAICRQMNIPCTSSDAAAMAMTLNKAISKAIAKATKIPTPQWTLVTEIGETPFLPFPPPYFVKPNAEGSSMGIGETSLAETKEAAFDAAWHIVETIGEAIIEQYLSDRELTVGLLGNENPVAFPVAEIRTGGRIYSKAMKSKDKMEEEVICPCDLPKEMQTRLIDWSKRLWRWMGIRGMARFDFKCDRQGNPTFLEVNPLPGMSKYYSVFTIQAKAYGLSYEAMIGKIASLAMERAKTEFRW